MSAWGLNVVVVVLALRVPSPWGGEPLASLLGNAVRDAFDPRLR